jgi:hypothetical protein
VPIIDAEDHDDYLLHYGIPRKSGRYKWGSGGTELSESRDFQSQLQGLRKEGMRDTDIAKSFGMTTTEMRAAITTSGLIIKQDKINTVEKLSNAGMSNKAIERETGIPESSVRALLAPSAKLRSDQIVATADMIKKRVDEDGFIDVGKGVEHQLGISKGKLDTAIAMLTNDGYYSNSVASPQVTTGHDTRVRVIAKPGEDWVSVMANRDKIRPLLQETKDGGQNWTPLAQEPIHFSPNRLKVVYGKEGGGNLDGVVYVRPGAKDLDMDSMSYAQVRIQVGDGHFIKGMAVKKEGLPDGVDLQFHTNKEDTGNKLDALKAVKVGGDPIERFGAVFRQLKHETGPNTGKPRSALNIVNDDDNWDDWSKNIASQMLSKQKPDFVKRQLDVTYANKKAQLDEILSLTNPVVKKELLLKYADDMDSSAIHLKAASLPRQKTHVILPVNSLKDNEVYAPNYKDGEKLVLIRYPHGGKFEIPELTVNNRNRAAREIMPPGTTKAAIGINSKVAAKLSGADFDGDTVVVIPNKGRRVSTEPSLEALKGFEPQVAYKGSAGKDSKGEHIMLPGVKKMTNTQTQMGMISNLITDMTIAGATHPELARAVRHSMVVIDAEKHGLDYKRSAEENGISALKKKYQADTKSGGASTIISRISGKTQPIPATKLRSAAEGGPIDPKTGELVYVPHTKNVRTVDPKTGEVSYRKEMATQGKPVKDADGNVVDWVQVPKTMKVAKGSRQAGLTDAMSLVSGTQGTPVERSYADYSNKVRALANEARKTAVNTPDPPTIPSAKKVYKLEVESLKTKLRTAVSNSPRERQAQLAAQVIIKMKKEAEPDMSDEQLKRVRTNALRHTRENMGAKPDRVDITPKEWEAIQNGAVAPSVLREILTKADTTRVKQLATPQIKALMQPHNVGRAKSLLQAGYTRAEVAEELGVSTSTLDRSLL